MFAARRVLARSVLRASRAVGGARAVHVEANKASIQVNERMRDMRPALFVL